MVLNNEEFGTFWVCTLGSWYSE